MLKLKIIRGIFLYLPIVLLILLLLHKLNWIQQELQRDGHDYAEDNQKTLWLTSANALTKSKKSASVNKIKTYYDTHASDADVASVRVRISETETGNVPCHCQMTVVIILCNDDKNDAGPTKVKGNVNRQTVLKKGRGRPNQNMEKTWKKVKREISNTKQSLLDDLHHNNNKLGGLPFKNLLESVKSRPHDKNSQKHYPFNMNVKKVSLKNPTNNMKNGMNKKEKGKTRKNNIKMKKIIPARDFDRQMSQTIVLLKSIVLQQRFGSASENNGKMTKAQRCQSCVNVLVVSDQKEHFLQIQKNINEKEKWAEEFKQLIHLTYIPAQYPPGSQWMRKLFRPCATLRLFLPDFLPSKYDSVIYLDTDFILLRNLDNLWREFGKFPSGKTVAGLAPCLYHYGGRIRTNSDPRSNSNSIKHKNKSQFSSKSRIGSRSESKSPKSSSLIPFYGPTGLNAGIMLMNLTRMRSSQWTHKIRMVTSVFQHQITLADQDILNIYFHNNPDEIHELTCDWNFRPFQCRPGSYCEDPALSQGISAIHGNALSFSPQGPEPLFYAFFNAFKQLKMDANTNTNQNLHSNSTHHLHIHALDKLLKNLELELDQVSLKFKSKVIPQSDCARFKDFKSISLARLFTLKEDNDPSRIGKSHYNFNYNFQPHPIPMQIINK